MKEKQQYDTYGLNAYTLKEVADRTSHILNIKLQKRDSMYYAGEYYRYKLSYGQGVKIYKNYDPVLDWWVSEEYKAHSIILAVSGLPNMNEIRRKLINEFKDIVLLGSKIYDIGNESDSDSP